jgi:uncharacterized protein YjbI with pentapeptide repeats
MDTLRDLVVSNKLRLGGINLAGAWLCNASLENAQLSAAQLQHADLRSSILVSSDLRHAKLNGADLRNANLAGAKLQHASLSPPVLAPNRFKPNPKDRAGYGLSYQGGRLLQNHATDTELNLFQIAQAKGAFVRGLGPWQAQHRPAILADADLSEANLREADLWGVDLRRAFLMDSDLAGANLSKADLEDAYLLGAKGLNCPQLTKAKNWSKAARDPDMACGSTIPEAKLFMKFLSCELNPETQVWDDLPQPLAPHR